MSEYPPDAPETLPNAMIDRLHRLKRLHSGFPSVRYADYADAMRAGDMMPPAKVLHALARNVLDSESIHEQRGGMAAIIGELWPHAEAISKASQQDIAQWKAEGMHPLDAVFLHTIYTMTHASMRWRTTERAREDIVQRVMLITNVQRSGQGKQQTDITTEVVRGAMAGMQVVFGVAEIVPERWQTQFGQPMPSEEKAKSISAKGLMPLLSVWKGMKTETVNTFEKRITKENRQLPHKLTRLTFRPEDFDLFLSKDGIWMPVPTEAIVQNMEAMEYPKWIYPFHGQCPTYSAYDFREYEEHEGDRSKMTNVFAKATQWGIRLARKHWLEIEDPPEEKAT